MPIFLLNVPICTQGMQRTCWPESGTIIVTGPYVCTHTFCEHLTNESHAPIKNKTIRNNDVPYKNSELRKLQYRPNMVRNGQNNILLEMIWKI